MAADVLQRDFTQIHNRLFRDTRLSFKAKGIFGLISTHRDGYGVTPEWIAAASADGPAAVKTGLRELEQAGYLVRHQERREDGTLGSMTYSITDMPSSQPVGENRPAVVTCDDAETRRSQPVGDYPPAVEPPAADRPHKKTSSKQISGENIISSRPSAPDTTEADANTASEETTRTETKTRNHTSETSAADGGDGALVQQLAQRHGVKEADIQAVLADVEREGRIRSMRAWAGSDAGQQDIGRRLGERARGQASRVTPGALGDAGVLDALAAPMGMDQPECGCGALLRVPGVCRRCQEPDQVATAGLEGFRAARARMRAS